MDNQKENKPKRNERTRIKSETMTIETHTEVNKDGSHRHAVLQDLAATMTVHAEKMKLLSRAEEGLVSESYSPYSGTPSKTSPVPVQKVK